MKRLAFVMLSLFIVVCLIVATERPAYGYVDPGSGLLAMQSLASVAAACGYFFRRRLRLMFNRPVDEVKEAVPVPAVKGKSVNAA
jgi:hypothetical protein